MNDNRKNICRVCFATNNLSSLFLKEGEISISEKIMSVSSIKISIQDQMPHSICGTCYNKLQECYKFKLLCEKSDATLRSQIYKENLDWDNDEINKEDTCDRRTRAHKNTSRQKYISKVNSLKSHTEVKFSENFEYSNNCVEQEEAAAITEINCSLKESGSSDNLFKKDILNDKISKTRQEQCPTCGRIMSSRFRLKMHLRTHSGEKPFKCHYCNKLFTLAHNLKVHQRVHTGEKPLICNECGKSFAQSAGLIAHQRLHSGAKPYHCKLCPARFRTVGHLQYHVKRHTGEKNFECETCFKAFITRSDLKQHMQTHSGDRLHICCVCGIRLARASHLKRHMAIHNGPRPFPCQVCTLTFLQKTDLQKHMKKHVHTEMETVKTVKKESDIKSLSKK